MKETTFPDSLKALSQGLAALTPKLTDEQQAVQALVDAMKIPWMGGEPSEPLQKALQVSLTGTETQPVGLWDLIARIEQQFGTAIDLMSPPKGRE
jgi:hypothetical protein